MNQGSSQNLNLTHVSQQYGACAMSQAAGVASSISVPAPTFLQRQGQASRVEFLGQEFGKEKLPILFYMVKPKHGKITFLCQVFAFQASTELKTCGPPQ